MKTFETISAIALSLLGLVTVILFIYSERKARKQLKAIYELQERNEALPNFRVFVLFMFGEDAYDKLPTYDEMLHDDKKLTFENYVNVDEFINLN